MISKISIKNIASYGETPAVLETDKKINLVYGLNGTGKTTLSNYLQDQGNACFSCCSISGLNNEKVLVYNQKFVSDNFYQDTQRGIFSLKSENKAAKEKIDIATQEINKLKSQIKNDELKTGSQFDLEKKQEDINSLQTSSEEKTWKIKNDYYGGDRILEFCLDGKIGSKKYLFDYISKLKKPDNKPNKSIEVLKKEAETTQGENAKSYDETLVKKVNYDFWNVENQEIFKEVIIGNENSQVAELINKLNISDWVKKGKEFLNEPKEENETCPFCQQKTITKELHQEIQDYFDETYQNKITSLENFDKEYWKEYQAEKNLETELLKIDFIKNKETEFKLLFKNFIDKVSGNWSKISNKIKSPNIIIDLESSILEQNALNDFLDTIVEEIKAHNDKIKNKQKTKKQIIKEFWEIMRWDYDQTIENHTIQNAKLEKEKLDIETKISEFNTKIDGQKKIIQDEQKEMVNIQDAIDAINSELIFFGLDGFSIVPAGEKSYKLKRPNEDIAKFETLSEGEKTVISFLYFLELCKGKENDDEVVTEKIVVIDDPISSLSHMYVFNIAQLIRKNFFNDDYKQVFILTHNLYFFHELLHKQKDNNAKLFRLCRSTFSQLSVMNRKDIQNEYQSYWQILKDYDEGKATEVILANAMRNILERFFGFIEKNDFNELTKELEKDEKNNFFIRYINKESHSDPINISDSKEIDPQIFKEAFRKIFKDSGYEAHYNQMMNLNNPNLIN
ncbi:MAG: AAA family ATPase [Candidatus Parcubacteria bacterium]|nr:AAA family ATPase [Candidatus Parcubacteria bacterium]